jgi:hypothetical protein
MPKRGAKLVCLPLPQFLKVGRAIAPNSFAHEVVLVKFEPNLKGQYTIYDINIQV